MTAAAAIPGRNEVFRQAKANPASASADKPQTVQPSETLSVRKQDQSFKLKASSTKAQNAKAKTVRCRQAF